MTKLPITTVIAAAAALALAGCHKSATDRLADRVENAADQRGDMLENQADALKAQAAALDNRADHVRAVGDQRADAIKAANMNVQAMSQEQRDAIVANQAPAVR